MSGKSFGAIALLLGLGLSFARGAAAESAASAENGSAVPLTIESCREKARAHYPLSRQYASIETARKLDLAIARRGYLPRLSLSGKASYQSDATSFGSLAESLPPQMAPLAAALEDVGAEKDQYQLLAETSLTVWDGGAIGAQVKGIECASRVESRKLDVQLHALNDRVDQLFFGVLSIRQQLDQNGILLGQLESNRRRVEASLRNGVASPYDLDAVSVEILNARQKGAELASAERSYRGMLAELIGEGIPEGAEFAEPGSLALPEGDEAGARPEFALFAAQEKQLDSQEAAVRASNMPRLSAFFQAAYGDPGLNMFESGAASYWIGGLRLTWSLNGLLDWKARLGLISEARKSVGAQREAFALDTSIQVARLREDAARLRELLATDSEIIALREGMRKSIEGKLENGAATTDDVLKAIDAESLARRTKALHEVQLAASSYALRNALSR
jgi:outer membrane protein TolC